MDDQVEKARDRIADVVVDGVVAFEVVVVAEDQEAYAEITTGLTYRRLSKRHPNDFPSKVFRLLRETP